MSDRCGIGAGKLELLSDGSFGNFTVNNSWNKPYTWCQGAFAPICAQAGNGAPAAMMLRLAGSSEHQGVANVAHALQWAASADATSYYTKRATTSGGPYTLVFPVSPARFCS